MSRQPATRYLGIDVGGTNIKVGLTDDQGQVLASTKVDTDIEESLEAGLKNMTQAVKDVLSQINISINDVTAIGLACPGPMDIKAGRLLQLANLPTWRNVDIRDIVAERLGRPVILQNDANAAAYGEYWAGAAQNAEIMALITLGTGIGSGVVIKGEILEGAHSHAAEYGFMIIQTDNGREHPGGGYHGVLESYASSRALILRAVHRLQSGDPSSLSQLLGKKDELTPLAIMQHAEAGDVLAHELIMEVARYIGVGIVSMMHTMNPEVILLGGAMTFGQLATRTGRDFLAGIKKEVKDRAFAIPAARTRIDYAQLGGSAGFIGAAGWAAKSFRA